MQLPISIDKMSNCIVLHFRSMRHIIECALQVECKSFIKEAIHNVVKAYDNVLTSYLVYIYKSTTLKIFMYKKKSTDSFDILIFIYHPLDKRNVNLAKTV